MKVLPPRTQPFAEPLKRRHRPAEASHWSSYRACLRWDFGFTCGFCLLHEADFHHGQPSKGTGIMTLEHRTLRSREPGRASDFDNCLLACKLCNQARGSKPLKHLGAELLDPTVDVWGDHFELVEDRLRPSPSSADAEYTHFAYDLNAPAKVTRRQTRRELLEDRLLLLTEIGDQLSVLLELAERLRTIGSPALKDAWERIVDLRRQAKRALGILRFYRAVPEDAPGVCRCNPQPELRLPDPLADQTLEVEEAWSF